MDTGTLEHIHFRTTEFSKGRELSAKGLLMTKSFSLYFGFTKTLFVENVTDKSGAPGKWYFFSSQLLRNFAWMR
jgi:hypothetical protein